MEDRTSRFLNYLLSNKRLTREQKKEISQLLVRDISIDLQQETENEASPDGELVPKARQHDVKPVFDFLHLFTEKEALKYTTHDWDKSPQGNSYCFANYTDFEQKYTDIIKKHNIYNYSEELWELTNNFLFNVDGKYSWGKYNIKIGYNKYVQQWMEKHPEEQPMNMQISAFPTSLRPGPINKRSLSSFRDVVEIFKHCIEFRDDDLYDMVLDIFDKQDLIIDFEKLESLKSRSFYTCTERIREALEKIAENAFSKGGKHPYIEISFHTEKEELRDVLVLEILQVDSFPDKPITHDKVLAKDTDGTIHQIIDLLYNLCDFSVESKFYDNKDQVRAFHIDYLVSEKECPLYYELSEDNCRGYKSILKFYSYHNEKDNNNR